MGRYLARGVALLLYAGFTSSPNIPSCPLSSCFFVCFGFSELFGSHFNQLVRIVERHFPGEGSLQIGGENKQQTQRYNSTHGRRTGIDGTGWIGGRDLLLVQDVAGAA
jgi:hypothetical protein